MTNGDGNTGRDDSFAALEQRLHDTLIDPLFGLVLQRFDAMLKTLGNVDGDEVVALACMAIHDALRWGEKDDPLDPSNVIPKR